MSERDWNDNYASDELPWDTGVPDAQLLEVVQGNGLPALAQRRALEIGCGTGTNALWLASQGYDVTGVDLAPLAIERARAKVTQDVAQRCRFEVHDFLDGEPLAGSFELVFDRGCFHVFHEAQQQARFAARVADLLVPGGTWLSLIGSTEGAPREFGPPRRSVRDIVAAVEPHLALVTLRAFEFDVPGMELKPKAWCCLSQKRTTPAQPSTVEDHG